MRHCSWRDRIRQVGGFGGILPGQRIGMFVDGCWSMQTPLDRRSLSRRRRVSQRQPVKSSGRPLKESMKTVKRTASIGLFLTTRETILSNLCQISVRGFRGSKVLKCACSWALRALNKTNYGCAVFPPRRITQFHVPENGQFYQSFMSPKVLLAVHFDRVGNLTEWSSG
jgi:hypothetical protein